jgi:hypothetical protein
MFDPVDYFLLLCCWCCDRKSKDEEEFEISERDRMRHQLKADLSEQRIIEQQPQPPPRLAHAPPLSPSDKAGIAG